MELRKVIKKIPSLKQRQCQWRYITHMSTVVKLILQQSPIIILPSCNINPMNSMKRKLNLGFHQFMSLVNMIEIWYCNGDCVIT